MNNFITYAKSTEVRKLIVTYFFRGKSYKGSVTQAFGHKLESSLKM